jgi:hypothetical protein
MSGTLWSLPLPSGKTAEVRDVTIGDLEEVGLDWDKLARRILISVDGVKDDKGGKWPFKLDDYSAMLAWTQGKTNPTAEQVRSVSREPFGDGASLITLDGRSVVIEIPEVEVWQSATNYGQSGLPGEIRLLRRCITQMDGKPTSYAATVSGWPFDATQTLLLHAELVRVISEPADKREARERRAQGIARAVTPPRA